MSIPATEVEARWNAAAEPFTAVVREVRDWDAATPCEGCLLYTSDAADDTR